MTLAIGGEKKKTAKKTTVSLFIVLLSPTCHLSLKIMSGDKDQTKVFNLKSCELINQWLIAVLSHGNLVHGSSAFLSLRNFLDLYIFFD